MIIYLDTLLPKIITKACFLHYMHSNRLLLLINLIEVQLQKVSVVLVYEAKHITPVFNYAANILAFF